MENNEEDDRMNWECIFNDTDSLSHSPQPPTHSRMHPQVTKNHFTVWPLNRKAENDEWTKMTSANHPPTWKLNA